MHTKLSLASVAAMAYQARAVTTTISATAAETPAQSLINIYDNCKVEVTDASTSHYEFLEKNVAMRPSFKFSGIDENCPDMTAKIWFEPPAACASMAGCPAEGYTVELTNDQIQNGATYNTPLIDEGIQGEWFMHVTISPDHFDCAMPITDFCMALHDECDNPPCPAPKCDPKINDFKGLVRNAKPDDEWYMGADHLEHTMTWTVDSVWNCDNLCTLLQVRPDNKVGDVEGKNDWQHMMKYSGVSDLWRKLGSTTYAPMDYNIKIVDCDDDDTVWDEDTVRVPNPLPPCNIGVDFDIESVKQSCVNDDDFLTVHQRWNNNVYSASCRQFEFTTDLVNGYDLAKPYESDQVLVIQDDKVYPTVPTPTIYDDLSYENLPINVTSRATLYARWLTDDKDPFKVFHNDAYEMWQPDCDYQVGDKPTFNYNIKEGKDILSHKLDFDFSVSGKISKFCPTFSGKVVVTLDGKEEFTKSLSDDDMASLWDNKCTEFTNPTVKVTEDGRDFKDGVYCMKFVITPDQTVKKSGKVQTESAEVCHTISAKPCVLTSKCALSYTHDTTNKEYAFTQEAEADGNAWCDPASYVYSYKYTDSDTWKDALADDAQPIRDQLEQNQKTKTHWKTPENDILFKTEFQVSYTNVAFKSQTAVTPDKSECSLDVSHYCRPGIKRTPQLTLDFVEATQNVAGTVVFTDQTQGYDECGDLTVDIKIRQVAYDLTPPYPIVANNSWTNPDHPDEGQKSMDYVLNFPDNVGCYEAIITYTSSASQEFAVATTAHECVVHTCTLESAALTHVKTTDAADQNTRDMAFTYDATWSRYCTDVSAKVCVTDKDSKITPFCSDDFDVVVSRAYTDAKSVKSQAATVTQSRDFDIADKQEYIATITVSDKGILSPKSQPVTATADLSAPLPPVCPDSPSQATFGIDGYFMTDNLHKVTLLAKMGGTSGAMCGAQSFCYNDQTTGVSACSTNYTGSWTVNSVSGWYTINGKITFANSNTEVVLTKQMKWEQGCRVQVKSLERISYAAYDADANRDSATKIKSVGTKVGECGGIVTVTGTLTGGDGSVQTVNLDQDKFFSADGVENKLTLDKYPQSYTWHVDVNAGQAPSIADHQALTQNDGYIQVLTDASQLVNAYNSSDPSPKDLFWNSPEPNCNVVVDSVQITGFKELSDCSDNMVATVVGTLHTEISCKNVEANIKLMFVETGLSIGNAVPTLVPDFSDATKHVYTFTHDVQGPNEYGEYFATLEGYDRENMGDKDSMDSVKSLWEPRCCLTIPSFTKVAQSTSLDGLRTDLSYSVQLGQKGDNACRDSTAKITMQDSNGKNTFVHFLSQTDTKQALDGGFDYTITVDTVGSVTAVVDWTDSRAIQDQQATAIGFIATTPVCKVNVVDFCIDDAKSVSDGRWAFEFRIRAEANKACGKMSVDLDLIKDDTTYLGHVTIDGDDIVDSFNCDCLKTFTVEADFDGSPGDIYGQLDVRNSAHQVVQITDSCVYTVATPGQDDGSSSGNGSSEGATLQIPTGA